MWVETLTGFIFSTGTIVLAAAAMQTVGYVFSSQITLRIFLLLGTLLYLIYYFVAAEDPLWPAIFGTICIGATSVYGLGRALANRSKWTITKDQLPIFEAMSEIEPGAFRKLMKDAHIKTFDAPTLMTEHGKVPEHVFYTLDGAVDVLKSNMTFSIERFNFIGEISIIGGFGATATVHSRAQTKVVMWDRAKLLAKMQRDERFRIAVEALFSKDMATKLAQAAKIS
ncbi:hypothetical protein [Planktotalea sp.]|uniref:hypothetical protein n=1 Tax=Planktotalea sp. TaxID=2029877 RepID=UPI003D6ADB2F